MMQKNKIILSFALTSLLMGLSTPTLASNDYDDDDRHYQQNRSLYISHDQAAQAAQNAVGGGYVNDVEFEHKLHRTYFDVEVRDNQGREYDVKIDAKTGKVISKHLDD